jgi:GNAT superfamily N-acetyltransferase
MVAKVHTCTGQLAESKRRDATMKATFQLSPCNVPDTAGSASAEAYAAGFRARAVLRDGTAVCLRAVRPDDKERMRIAFERLSPQTVYRRFFHHLTVLMSGALREATELDFHDHVGLALTVGEGTSEKLIAVGEFVRVAPGANCAEVAFVVADDYQHRGAATLLLQHLVHIARDLGVRELLALVLEDNREMLEVLEHSQLPLRQTAEHSVRRVLLSLEAAT